MIRGGDCDLRPVLIVGDQINQVRLLAEGALNDTGVVEGIDLIAAQLGVRDGRRGRRGRISNTPAGISTCSAALMLELDAPAPITATTPSSTSALAPSTAMLGTVSVSATSNSNERSRTPPCALISSMALCAACRQTSPLTHGPEMGTSRPTRTGSASSTGPVVPPPLSEPQLSHVRHNSSKPVIRRCVCLMPGLRCWLNRSGNWVADTGCSLVFLTP